MRKASIYLKILLVMTCVGCTNITCEKQICGNKTTTGVKQKLTLSACSCPLVFEHLHRISHWGYSLRHRQLSVFALWNFQNRYETSLNHLEIIFAFRNNSLNILIMCLPFAMNRTTLLSMIFSNNLLFGVNNVITFLLLTFDNQQVG